MLVLKERKTRFVLAARLAGKSAAETVAIMMAVFRRLDPRLRASITFDNDTAFARHGLLASACSMATWFCDAYASWQKGAVENANGLLRRDLPRDLDLDAMSDAELQEIILSHNLTPRKCLGFLTPLQALLAEPCDGRRYTEPFQPSRRFRTFRAFVGGPAAPSSRAFRRRRAGFSPAPSSTGVAGMACSSGTACAGSAAAAGTVRNGGRQNAHSWTKPCTTNLLARAGL